MRASTAPTHKGAHQLMRTSEIAKRYLDYFSKHDHLVMPSASLISPNPTTLFTIAGMVPFIPYLLGEQTPPHKRMASNQKCVRTLDIDEVGKTTRHGTFFQMLGNFSFGDYFKEEAIHYAWELLTTPQSEGGYGFDPEKLWVTTYTDDEEARSIWKNEGFDPEHMQIFGMEDNFWTTGGPGPGGPCSEIYVDRGPEYGKDGGPAADETRFIEIWDLVFENYEVDNVKSKTDLHIRGINQNEAIKMVKRKITDLDAMKIQEQKKAARSGYDLDILPSDLSTYGGAAKNLLQDLQSRNERMSNMTFLMLHLAPTKQKLEIAVSQSASVAQTHNCILTRLDFQQEDGLMSSLPLGLNRIKIERSLTTSALAVFVPFVTQELFMGGNAMYYGLNALSNNMILLDRKQSRCPNGLVFGTPGSGKSMSCKREITYVMLTTKDNVIICDPEDEYSPLVNRLGGQVIRLSPNSRDYVNPLDINLNYSEEENPLALKSDFVLSFCELIMGSKTGLEAIEKTVIDRAVQIIYQPYFADPRPENMPVLGDLLDALMAQGIPEAERVAQALDLYVNGSLNFFNHRTTVDIRNRLVCFDIKGLGKNLKKPGMLIVQDAVWNTVTVNRSIGRSTWYFVDEFHLLLKEEQTAAYSAEIWKRFRKWGGVPTGATQNPKDLLSSPEIENILENSDFIYLLNLSAGDRKLMTERLNISAEQLAYVTNADPGSGLLFFQNVIIPFRDEFPKDTELYKLLTTKPSEVAHDGESR